MTDDEVPIEQPAPRNDFLLFREAILDHAGAEAALDELSRQGVDLAQFVDILAFTAANLLPPPETKRQPDWEIPGLPRRRLIKLAERLEGIAQEIEAVDSHEFVKGTYGILPRDEEEKFKELPNLLRDRAFSLKVQVGVNSRLYPSIERAVEKQIKISLIEYVRQSTQKNRPMYQEVALLLTAALYEGGYDHVVTPESLRTLWHDWEVPAKR